MSEEFLPLSLDCEQVRIESVKGGWEIIVERDDEDIVFFDNMPDATYDQLVEYGVINR